MNNIPSKIIMDSGPLLVALTLNYVNVMNITNKEIYLRKSYKRLDNIQRPVFTLTKFFDGIHFFYSTPHVIGELTGLVKSRLELRENEYEFWKCSIDYLILKNFSEKLISLLELSNDSRISPLIQKIGFVDTELIKYANENNLPILSIDKRTLKNEADKKKIDVLILEDDIYRYSF